MPKYKRSIAVGITDTHGGNKLALLNPDTILEDEDREGNISPYHPGMTDVQKYLWDLYAWAKGEIEHLAGHDPIHLFHIGDQTQGNKYPHEWVSTRLSDQLDIATWNLMPWLEMKNVQTVRMAKGTASHEFGEGSAPVLIQRRLQAQFPKKDIKTVFHGLVSVGGIRIDYSHHGPFPGSRNWLKGNEARYYLRSLMMDEIAAGNNPPDVVWRGHYHEYIREWLEVRGNGHRYASWLMIIPSMSMVDAYARQAARSPSRVSNGMVALEIINGKIHDIHPFIKSMDIRTREEL